MKTVTIDGEEVSKEDLMELCILLEAGIRETTDFLTSPMVQEDNALSDTYREGLVRRVNTARTLSKKILN